MLPRDPRSASNARHITHLLGDRDFALITHTHRIGGITDTPDLTTTPSLLILTRSGHGPFQAVVDNRDQ